MQWDEIVRAVAGFPQLFGRSIQQSLKPKVQWLVGLGLKQDQVVRIISTFPAILGCSISKNLEPKKVLLQRVLGADGTAEVVLKLPQILSYRYERLSMRLDVLVARNETSKLAKVMTMTEDRFKARFFDGDQRECTHNEM